MVSENELAELYAYPQSDEPWFRSSFVSTIDGAATGADGVSASIGGTADERVFAMMRSLCDVILVGASTASIEKYGPVKRDEINTRLRASQNLADVPKIAVVTRSLDIPPALLRGRQIVITVESASPDKRQQLGSDVDLIVAGQEEVDWSLVRKQLQARRLRRVLCEGGPSLHGRLLDADVIDEICLTIAPELHAGTAPRIAQSRNAVPRKMLLAHLLSLDGAAFGRWIRDRPSAG